MKLKSTLLSLAVALAFTMPINAAQYTVPEGQPPVPGADASIPDTAYQNYRYDKTRNIPTAGYIALKDKVHKTLEKQISVNKRSAEDAKKWEKSYDKYLDLISYESTVVLLHEGDYKAKMTVPISVVDGYLKKIDKETTGSYVVEKNVVAGLIGTTKKVENEAIYKTAQRKGEFMYPGISKGYWGITDKYTNENLPIMFATVTFNKYPTQNYIAILSNRNQPVTKKLESTMANFVIPSIQPLENLDNTSDAITWDNFTYRLPKGMMLKEDRKLNKVLRRVYTNNEMRLVVVQGPLAHQNKPISQYTHTILSSIIHKNGDVLLKDVPIQGAVIWNNGVPSYLLDQYNPGKLSRIYHLIQDDKNEYFIILSYVDGKVKYNHLELRNMMEYLDFKNANELRSKIEKKLKQ